LSERVNLPRRGSYGIDAPYAPAVIAAIIVVFAVLAIVAHNPGMLVSMAFMLAVLGSYLYTTLRGKHVVWAGLLARAKLRGDERILDLGCGRGAVLLLAAKHLSTGRAVGVDLWRSVDQSGNSIEATQRNAATEGVADRIDLHTGDMTALPFDDRSFDVVVSSLAVHNIGTPAGRDQAIAEAVRVLRPGGRLMLADIRATRRYQDRLAALGMLDVARRGLGWRFWWGGPWAATHLVTATKPAAAWSDAPTELDENDSR